MADVTCMCGNTLWGYAGGVALLLWTSNVSHIPFES